MHIIRDLKHENPLDSTILTIGAFDGIHLGHQAIIRRLAKHARDRGLASGMVTFDPHPRVLLSPESETLLLTTLDEKIELVQELGIDLMVIMHFDHELAMASARDFVRTLSVRLRMLELWVGRGFRLGRDREGDAANLEEIGEQMGFRLRVVEPVSRDAEIISSTEIRALLGEGNVARAAALLGRNYQVAGEVVHGAGRGRTLGFPTANLDPPPGKLAPANGVYAACTKVAGVPYQAVVNIGVRPSFDNGQRIIEAHLLDFDGDLYGQILRIEFVEFLRPERHFPSVDALVHEIRRDCDRARQSFCTLDASRQGALARSGI